MRLHRTLSLAMTALMMLSGLVVFSSQASAHVPIYDSGGPTMDSALQIPNPSISYATYAEFEAKPNQIQFYSISVTENQKQYIELDVPSVGSSKGFAPILLLIGPGLSAPDQNTSDMLNFFGVNLTAGQGALSWEYKGPLTEEEFEPFTQVVLLKRQSLNVTLPESGTYYICVTQQPFHPKPNENYIFVVTKYILVTGTLEKFTVADYILIPYDWIKGHLFWDENPAFFMLPTYAVVIGGIATAALLRRSRPTPSAVGVRRPEQLVFYVALAGGLLMLGGAANQLIFLFGNPLFSLGVGETIVLTLQSIGIVLGIFAIRQSFTVLKPTKWFGIFVAAVIFAIALIVGAGFIVGPVLFLAAVVAGFTMSRRKVQAA